MEIFTSTETMVILEFCPKYSFLMIKYFTKYTLAANYNNFIAL